MTILSNPYPPILSYYYLSSKDRLDKSSPTSNFRVRGISIPKPEKVILHSVCFPNSIYNVNSNNNQFPIGIWDTSRSYEDQRNNSIYKILRLIEGQYDNITDFITMLQAVIRAQTTFVDMEVTVDNLTKRISFNSAQTNYAIYNNSDMTANTLIGFDDYILAVGPGYPAPNYTTDSILIANSFPSKKATLTNTFNLAGCTSLFLCSEYLAQNSTVRVSGPGISSIVSRIPMSDFQFGDIVQHSAEHVYGWPGNIDMDFRLVDDAGKIAPLNGGDIEITLIVISEPNYNL